MTANWPTQLTKLATVTSSGAAAAGAHSSFNATTGPLTATLPALTTGAIATALAAGQVVRAKISKSKSDSTRNALTVACSGSDTFEGGAAAQVLNVPGEKLTVVAQTVPGGSGPVWVIEDHSAPRDSLDKAYVLQAAGAFRKRDRPGNPMSRVTYTAPTVMTSPPTVRCLAASAISGNVITKFTPPAKGKSTGGAGTIVGATIMAQYSNRPTTNGNNNTTLAAPAAAGATTIQVNATTSGGQYWIGPNPSGISPTSGYTQAWLESGELVTISNYSGSSAPYTATLAAPLQNPHLLNDTVVTTAVPGPGYNTGSALVPIAYGGCAPQYAFEIETDEPTVEFFCYFVGSGRYRIWVDGQVATSGYQTLATGGTNGDSTAQPAQNAAGFISIAFGSRQFRRIRLETGQSIGIPMIGVSTSAIGTVICPEEPTTRVLWIGDSYLGGFDSIEHVASRILGWDNIITDQVGGTGYEADNTANLAYAGRVGYRLPIHLASRPDVIVVTLGLNDSVSGTLSASITAELSALRTAFPLAPIYVLGPWATTTSSNAGKQGVAQAIQAVCATVGVTYIDTIQGLGAGKNPWVSGTGNSGSTTGNGNSDIMLNSDGVHPTPPYGVPYNGVRIAQGIIAAQPS